jgi:hypothetical protein
MTNPLYRDSGVEFYEIDFCPNLNCGRAYHGLPVDGPRPCAGSWAYLHGGVPLPKLEMNTDADARSSL